MELGEFSEQASVDALPSGWQSYTIGQTLTLINGLAFKPSEWKAHGTPIVRIQNLNDDGSPYNYCDSPVSGKYLIRPGDILFAWSGTTGTSFGARIWAGPNAVLNQHIFKVIPDKTKLTPHYSFLVLQNVQDEIERRAHGFKSSFVHVKKSDLVKVSLPIPPISEQRAIIEVLSEMDQLIANLCRLVEKKQAIKHGLMQQLLTGKLRLPGFDAPWADIRLGHHVTYVKTVALSRAQLDATSPLRYLHYGDIHTSPEVRLAAATAPMPRAPQALAKSAGRLQVGDLVFADASEDLVGVGKSTEIVSVPPEGVIAGLHTIAARFNKTILADGFKAYLQFIPSFREALLRLASGTKVLATTRSYISSITLNLPSAEEQRAISRVLVDCDEEIAALRDRVYKARAIKQGVMQELLTGRTRLPVRERAS